MAGYSHIEIFVRQMRAFKELTHKRANEAKKELARQTVARLASRSPVLTGRYILSHRVRLNTPDTSYEIASPVLKEKKHPGGERRGRRAGVDHRGLVSTARGKANTVINQAQAKDSIHISNSIPWANFVEYLGWVSSNTPAYHVYGLTKQEMRIIAQGIVEKFRRMKK